jgi:hypothetical protein
VKKRQGKGSAGNVGKESLNVDSNEKRADFASPGTVNVEQIEKLALALLQWVALDIKPIGGRIRSRNDASSVLPGLLSICENHPREVVQWLRANGHLPAVISVVQHLEREVNIKDLEDRIKRKRYSGPYPAPAMMMAADSYILNVSRSFIEAADSYCVREKAVESAEQTENPKLTVAKRNSGKGKLEIRKNLPLVPQKPIKHTDVFSNSLVRNGYRKVVEDFAERFAIESKSSFLGSMLSSRQVTTWNFSDGNITQSDGSWGHRSSMHVSTTALRARILLHVGVDLSKTRIYREFGVPHKDLQLNVLQTPNWQLVASGFWYEDTYHSGHIAYFLAKTGPSEWTMESVERSAILDGVTQDDVDEGLLNDDQIQAMWGVTLGDAQRSEYRQVVCIYADKEVGSKPEDIAAKLYRQVCDSGGKKIDEFDSSDGLLN